MLYLILIISLEFKRIIDKLDFEENITVGDVLKIKVYNYEKLKAARAQSSDAGKFNAYINFAIKGETYEKKIINYVLLIPQLINVECMLNNKKIMRRFRNSILDMKESINFHNYLKNY